MIRVYLKVPSFSRQLWLAGFNWIMSVSKCDCVSKTHFNSLKFQFFQSLFPRLWRAFQVHQLQFGRPSPSYSTNFYLTGKTQTILFVNFSKAFDSIHRRKMEQILLAYGQPKETIAAIMMLCRNRKIKVRFPDGDTDYFNIVAGVLQGDILAPYLLIICQEHLLIKWKKIVSS